MYFSLYHIYNRLYNRAVFDMNIALWSWCDGLSSQLQLFILVNLLGMSVTIIGALLGALVIGIMNMWFK